MSLPNTEVCSSSSTAGTLQTTVKGQFTHHTSRELGSDCYLLSSFECQSSWDRFQPFCFRTNLVDSRDFLCLIFSYILFHCRQPWVTCSWASGRLARLQLKQMLLLFRAAGFVVAVKEQQLQQHGQRQQPCPHQQQQQGQNVLHASNHLRQQQRGQQGHAVPDSSQQQFAQQQQHHQQQRQQHQQQHQQDVKPVLEALKAFLAEAAAVRQEQTELRGTMLQRQLVRVCREVAVRDEKLGRGLHVIVRKDSSTEEVKTPEAKEQQQQMGSPIPPCSMNAESSRTSSSRGMNLDVENQSFGEFDREFLVGDEQEGLQGHRNGVMSDSAGLHGQEDEEDWLEEYVQGMCLTAEGKAAGRLQNKQPQEEGQQQQLRDRQGMEWEDGGSYESEGSGGDDQTGQLQETAKGWEFYIPMMLFVAAQRSGHKVQDLLEYMDKDLLTGAGWLEDSW